MTKACLLASLLALVGCDQLDNCPDAQDPITVEPLPATPKYAGSVDLDSLSYESAPWNGKLARFPPDTVMRFVHDLGFAPRFVDTFVSFTSTGTGDGDVTENAGNQGRIRCVDAHEIVVVNDTCEENFFIRVSAWAVGTESDDGTLCQKELDSR